MPTEIQAELALKLYAPRLSFACHSSIKLSWSIYLGLQERQGGRRGTRTDSACARYGASTGPLLRAPKQAPLGSHGRPVSWRTRATEFGKPRLGVRDGGETRCGPDHAIEPTDFARRGLRDQDSCGKRVRQARHNPAMTVASGTAGALPAAARAYNQPCSGQSSFRSVCCSAPAGSSEVNRGTPWAMIVGHLQRFSIEWASTYDQACPSKSTMVSRLTCHNPGVHVGRPGWHLRP